MSKKRRFVGVQFIETVREGKHTFAFGVYHDSKLGRIPFAGLAEKNPQDKENATRGRNLAIGRAAENLGKTIQKQVWENLKPGQKAVVVSTNKLTEAQKKAFMESAEAVAKRVERQKKHDKENAKTAASPAKKGIKSGTTGKKVPSK